MKNISLKWSIMTALTCAFVLAWSPLQDNGAAAASAKKCQPDTIVGDWKRVQKGGVALDAVWSFQADNKIACSGKQCARAAGQPLSYTLSRGKTTLTFERGSMSKSKCRIADNTMFLDGGADQGGFTFVRH